MSLASSGPDAAGVLRRRASPRRQQTPASGGHCEIWLYNSLTNFLPLGRLRAGVDHLSLPLPRGAARYRWIDISLQPVGTVFHSGESRLRAANPRFGTSGP